MQITREILIDASPDAVWHALTDDDTVADWLDEPAARVVLDAQPGELLTWAWWPNDNDGELSTVQFMLTETDDGSTRVTVTEQRVAPSRACTAGAGSIDADADDGWGRRLVGLELRCLTMRRPAVA
jgi:uncharacterized protein YndB with AHSA1/START domain